MFVCSTNFRPILSETYVISYLYYINTGETDKREDFTQTLKGATFTYNSTEKMYTHFWSGEDITPLLEIPMKLPVNNIKISFDMMSTIYYSYHRGQIRVGLANDTQYLRIGGGILNNRYISNCYSEVTSESYEVISSNQSGIWFHHEWWIQNGNITIKIYKNETEVYSKEYEDITILSNATKLSIQLGMVRTYVNWKNLKVTSL